MDLVTTLAITAALLALAVFAGWRGALPPDLIKGPRMIPWRGIMVMSAAGLLVLFVHLANLMGLYHPR